MDIEEHFLATQEYMRGLVSNSCLDEQLKEILADRLTIRNRFWPSELLLRVAGTFGTQTEALYPALCAAIECFHVQTLLQDDIIDGHQVRWNKPSLVAIAGTTTAMLCSDWLMSQSITILADLPDSRSRNNSLLHILGKRSIEIVQGQLLDVACNSVDTISMDEYLRLARLKTSVGVMATEMGALMSGVTHKDSRLVEEFSAHAGICSQIANDVSELFGTRGFRVPYCQLPRGRNELFLGRKTIFHVAFHGSESRPLFESALRVQMDVPKLRDWLVREGALAFAEETYYGFKQSAKQCLKIISGDVTMLTQYLETANSLYAG